MSAEVIPFCFESQSVRVISQDGEPWFVAKDVCEILDIQWRGSSTISYLDDDEKGVRNFRTPSGLQDLLIISESGLYTLIIRSNKPQAKPFRRWVTKEVLPTIRKTGSYALPQADKRVVVKMDHSKTTSAPGGLDIRYTMNLDKIVANPSRRSIELLERLTGIQLTDIPLQDDSHDELQAELVKKFCVERCLYAENIRTPFALVYGAYRQNCTENGLLPVMAVSRKRFSSLAAAAGYNVQKIGGTACFTDMRLVDKEVAQ